MLLLLILLIIINYYLLKDKQCGFSAIATSDVN